MHFTARFSDLCRFSRRLPVVGGMLVVTTIAAAGLTIWDLHEEAIRSDRQNMASLGVVLAEQLSRSIQAVDLVLREVQGRILANAVGTPEQYGQFIGSREIHEFLKDRLKSLPQADAIILSTSDGEVVNSSRNWPHQKINVSDRDFYRHFREHDDPGLFVSEPIKSRIMGIWTVYIVRCINGPHGEFLGLVHGAVRVQYFEAFYQAISLRDGEVVTLLRRDGVVLARYPELGTPVGARVPPDSHWYARVAENGGTYRTVRRSDGVARIVSVHPLREYPLVVDLTISEWAALAHWRQQAVVIAIGAFCAIAGFILLFRVLAVQFRRLERSEVSLEAQNAELEESRGQLQSQASELAQATAALRKSQDHLARAQGVADIGSFECDLQHGDLMWSDNLYKIFGLDKDKCVPNVDNVLPLVHPDDVELYQASYRQALADHPVAGVGYRIIRPDGECRHLVRETEVIRDGGGAAVGLLGTVRDITSAVRAEAHSCDLELQLQHSQRIESLGTLAGGIAHDLNNTIVPVVALSKLLLKKSPPTSAEHADLEMIHQAGIRARDLVKQILAFSRKEKPSKQLLDLADFVRATVPMVRAMVPATIDLRFTAQEALPPVLGDPGQLHQVLINLIVNAADAIGRNIGRIDMALTKVEVATGVEANGAGAALRLSVSDTGPGMDKAIMDRVFEPFFTTKGVGRGTGLGLSVVHGIVASHGGTITVESALGQGTRFDIVVPCASTMPEQDQPTVDGTAQGDASASTPPGPGREEGIIG